MKEIYILAVSRSEPVSREALRAVFESDEVKFSATDSSGGFTIEADTTHIDVQFEPAEKELGWTPDMLLGTDEAHQVLRTARGFYRLSFAPGKPQPSVAVFEALWCARTLMEHADGVLLDVTSFKLHEPQDVAEITELDFDIRDHVNLHAVEATTGETPLWVHSHGMEKFGLRDVELFYLAEDDLLAAESFLHELCTDMAFGQGPPERALVETSSGHSFMLVPADEARTTAMGVALETFEGHEGLFYTVVSPEGRHVASEMLKPYRERFEKEDAQVTEDLKGRAQQQLPAFKARFARKGLMEPLTFLVRAPFDTHPEGEEVTENLWLEVVSWDSQRLVGRLVDGAVHTTEWRKGAHVEIDEGQINAISLGREGRPMDESEVELLLRSERPS